MEKTIRRLSALALSLAMLLSLSPMSALAAEDKTGTESETEDVFRPDIDAEDGAILQGDPALTGISYVLMNIPYGDFYASEVDSGAPNAADTADIDAWTSATRSKPLNGNLSAGSYHVNSDGSDISGVIYPVQVSDLSLLNGQTQVTDETTVSITTTTRGETSTIEYKGADALFESPSYSYYVLSEAPAVYKVLTLDSGGAFSFGPVNATPRTVSGITATLNYETHHNNDVEIALNGVELPEGAVVSGVIVTDSDGAQYPLRHMEGIWRQTQIGWPDTAAAGIGGKTIQNVRFILRDGVVDCPVDFLVKPKLNATLSASFASVREITVSGLTDAVQNPTSTVTYTTGERPNVETHTVAENVSVTDGKVAITEDAIDGTAYTVKVVSDNYGDKSASVTYNTPQPSETAYVLMNIPYADFYAAEVDSGTPYAADIDAWTSATKSKPLNGNLSAGSYHVNSDGSDISGVIYPVQVSDLSLLDGKTQVTDETTVSITTTTRGETSTTEYKGAGALFQSASYSYYVLSEAPTVYKVLTINGGAFSFGPVNATAQTVSGVTATLNYETHHNNDVEIALNGVELPEGAVVSGVIVTDSNGAQYPLRHMEGIWRQTQIGWPDTAAADIGGKTITNVRFILLDGVLDCPVNFLVKPKLNATLSATFASVREITVSGLTDAVQNPIVTVTYTTGERPNVETHIVADGAAVTDGKVTLTEDAIDGTAYTVMVVSNNYGDKSASVTYTASGTPDPTPGTDTPDPDTPTPTPNTPDNPTGQGCYVATSVYGSYDCPEVWTLRRYRDEVLGDTWYGRLFIHLYYAVSPTAVRLYGNTALFQSFFRSRLDRMVSSLQADGFASTPYQDRDW